MPQLRRGQIMGQNALGVQIDPSFFEALENKIRWAEGVRRKLPYAMNDLAHIMALVNLGIAQKYSAGTYDPNRNHPEWAWKVPVRRITGRYYFGWKVRRMGLGYWQLYNDSREAFFIEFGIHRNPATGQPSARRIRRPIQKLSLMKTLLYLRQTAVYNRIWSNLFMPPIGQRTGRGFIWRMQSPEIQAQITPGVTGTNLFGGGLH